MKSFENYAMIVNNFQMSIIIGMNNSLHGDLPAIALPPSNMNFNQHYLSYQLTLILPDTEKLKKFPLFTLFSFIILLSNDSNLTPLMYVSLTTGPCTFSRRSNAWS